MPLDRLPEAPPVAAFSPGGLAVSLGGLAGWRRRLTAAGLGVLSVAALPPLHLLPVLLLAFPGLLWLLDGARDRRAAFAIGWWFGFGHFAAGLYWVSHALLVDPAFAWMIPLAVFGMGAGFGLFIAVATLLVHLSGTAGFGRILVLASVWVGLEWVRAWLLTGFPWNLIGTVWAFSPAMIQLAAVTGVYGLSLVTVLAASAPAMLAEDRRPPRRPLRRQVPVGGAVLLLALVWGFGEWRLAGAVSREVPDLRLRLVQPGIPQASKWVPALRESHLQAHLDLSRSPGFAEVTHVIWPETAVPFFLGLDDRRRAMVAQAVPAGGLVITGAPRAEAEGGRLSGIWNSLAAVDDQGRIVGVYDKSHLVPFGEYIPLRGVLPLDKITPGDIDFTPGPGLTLLDLPGLPPFTGLICYEVIFPGAVTPAAARPEWLLNVTNDGWFGISAGPFQHFASARLRAVEEGLPLIRVANTGISAIIDPYGRSIAELGLGRRGVVDGPLPRPLARQTPYAYLGNAIPLSLSCSFLALGLITGRRRPSPSRG